MGLDATYEEVKAHEGKTQFLESITAIVLSIIILTGIFYA